MRAQIAKKWVETPDNDFGALIERRVSEHQAVIENIASAHRETIVRMAKVLTHCLKNGHCIFWFGNGGSASDSQHLAAEFVGRFVSDRRALRSVALTTDTSILTSVGNDFGFDQIFSRQIEALGRPGDVAVGLSTSGNSDNVINGICAAREAGLRTMTLLGKCGGQMRDQADISLIIDDPVTARIQEAHIFVGHLLCELVETDLDLVE
ncbi:D-sedoheptulose 7-phosphate isomerase [Cohaesibacter sp. ES.047]|uniref:D-sedoheptulose-7-phosphate isomerase n=1 Tax=Cohaesibacter sp. ES.047 TaxID=1798205 RepID=UPI000BB905FC|nr:D-sedoheptulose 7-phosphate isomerase [Cohaesibacter sp. ES.047]SNY94286.1 D-sedoheptulose 7-phosphate isomerase [Cohaesibacter sp. ES.047]